MKSSEMSRRYRPLPEVKAPGTLGKIIHVMMHVRPIVWLTLTLAVSAAVISVMPGHVWASLGRAMQAHKFVVGMLLVFCLVTLSLLWAAGQRIDVFVFMLINKRGKRPKWLDQFMLGFTQIGNGVFAFALAAAFYLLDFHRLSYEIVLGTLSLWLVVELVKVLMQRKRPYSFLPDIRILGRRERGHSFPSGHTSQAFFLASLLSHYFMANLSLSVLLYAVALTIGITRIYVGMHYPRDVLGGIILGTTWGMIAISLHPAFLMRWF